MIPSNATRFDLVVPDDVQESALPTDEELCALRDDVDPLGFRELEFRELREAAERRIADARESDPTTEGDAK